VIALVAALSSASASAAAPAPESSEPASDAGTPAETWVEPSREPAPGPEPEPAPSPGIDPKNHRLVVAGNVVTGLGLGAFIMMTTGFLVASDGRDRLGFATAREDEDEIAKQERRVRTGNIVGITGAAATGALLISGLTLIGVGRSRERKRRAALAGGSLVPLLSPRMVGARWVFRF
jgi:hypothetical protein